jgi:hypothetical protein
VSKTLATAVSAFGASAKAKLANIAISGAPEDQLRGPLETFVKDLAELAGSNSLGCLFAMAGTLDRT